MHSTVQSEERPKTINCSVAYDILTGVSVDDVRSGTMRSFKTGKNMLNRIGVPEGEVSACRDTVRIRSAPCEMDGVKVGVELKEDVRGGEEK